MPEAYTPAEIAVRATFLKNGVDLVVEELTATANEASADDRVSLYLLGVQHGAKRMAEVAADAIIKQARKAGRVLEERGVLSSSDPSVDITARPRPAFLSEFKQKIADAIDTPAPDELVERRFKVDAGGVVGLLPRPDQNMDWMDWIKEQNDLVDAIKPPKGYEGALCCPHCYQDKDTPRPIVPAVRVKLDENGVCPQCGYKLQ